MTHRILCLATLLLAFCVWPLKVRPQLPELVNTTAEHFTIREVSADKAYLSRANLDLIDKLGGTAYVPFKSNSDTVVPPPCI